MTTLDDIVRLAAFSDDLADDARAAVEQVVSWAWLRDCDTRPDWRAFVVVGDVGEQWRIVNRPAFEALRRAVVAGVGRRTGKRGPQPSTGLHHAIYRECVGWLLADVGTLIEACSLLAELLHVVRDGEKAKPNPPDVHAAAVKHLQNICAGVNRHAADLSTMPAAWLVECLRDVRHDDVVEALAALREVLRAWIPRAAAMAKAHANLDDDVLLPNRTRDLPELDPATWVGKRVRARRANV